MEFSIKYTSNDYSAASLYEIRKVFIEESKNPDSFINRTFTKIANYLILVFHKFGKLKHTYHFSITEESLTRSHNEQSGTIKWNRVFSYLNHPKYFKLDLEHGSLLIPKRILTNEWITRLTSILKTNNIEEKPLIALSPNT